MTTESRPEHQQSEFPRPENPRNTPLRHRMQKLVEIVGMRELWTEQPGIQASFPIAGKDLKDSPTITKLLPSAATAPFLQVTTRVGYQLLPPDSYPRNPQIITRLGKFSIRHPHKEEPPHRTGYIGLSIEASRAVSGHDESMIIFADVNLARSYRIQEATDEIRWQTLDDEYGKPEDIVDEITQAIERLKTDFWEAEKQRAEAALTPQEQKLVTAISKKAKDIRLRSAHRGFHDEYVLFGHINSDGRLEKLSIGFAPGNDDYKITGWRDPNVLDGIQFEAEEGLKAKTQSSLKRTSKDVYGRYKAEGKVKIKGATRDQEIPVYVLELDRDGPVRLQDVNAFVAKGFNHYLEHRAWNIEWACPKDSVVLSTSVEK